MKITTLTRISYISGNRTYSPKLKKLLYYRRELAKPEIQTKNLL